MRLLKSVKFILDHTVQQTAVSLNHAQIETIKTTRDETSIAINVKPPTILRQYHAFSVTQFDDNIDI